jgi:tetratricopeptide (TPR) repeat protein
MPGRMWLAAIVLGVLSIVLVATRAGDWFFLALDNAKTIYLTNDLLGSGDPQLTATFVTSCRLDESADLGNIAIGGQLDNGCHALASSKLACANGDFGEALDFYRLAENRCSREALLSEWGGQLTWAGGHHTEAIARWKQLPSSELYAVQLLDLVDRQDRETRRLLLEELVLPGVYKLSKPLIQKVSVQLGVIYAQEDSWSMALALFQDSVKLAPERPVLWVRLGQAYRQTGQYDASMEALQKAIALLEEDDPYNLGLAHEELSIVQQALGSRAQAIRSLESALHYFEQSDSVGENYLELRRQRLAKLISQDTP